MNNVVPIECYKKMGINMYVIVFSFLTATARDWQGKSAENVIFLHGFLSSSRFWTETVFQNLSEPVKCNYRLFAVDLLGFGGSPKPRDCLYTLKDHLEMIEKSVIFPFQLNSFHLVAHSMGCIIAIALAEKHLKSVKSITLVAPVSSQASTMDISLLRFFIFLSFGDMNSEPQIWRNVDIATSLFMQGRLLCFLNDPEHL